jgi:hypothetical protein
MVRISNLDELVLNAHARLSQLLKVMKYSEDLGFKVRYDSSVASNSFFFVVRSATISLT